MVKIVWNANEEDLRYLGGILAMMIYINSGFDQIKTDCLYLLIRPFLTLRYIVTHLKNFVTNLTVLNSKFIICGWGGHI